MIINQVGGGTGSSEINFGDMQGTTIDGFIAPTEGVYGTGMKIVDFPSDGSDTFAYGEGDLISVSSKTGVTKKKYDPVTNTVNVIETVPIAKMVTTGFSTQAYVDGVIYLTNYLGGYPTNKMPEANILNSIDTKNVVNGSYKYKKVTMKKPVINGAQCTSYLAGMWKGNLLLVLVKNPNDAYIASAKANLETGTYEILEYYYVDSAVENDLTSKKICLYSGNDWMIFGIDSSQHFIRVDFVDGVPVFSKQRTHSSSSGNVNMIESTGMFFSDFYGVPAFYPSDSSYPPLSFFRWENIPIDIGDEYKGVGGMMIGSNIGLLETSNKGVYLMTKIDGLIKLIPIPKLKFKSPLPLSMRLGVNSPPDGGYVNNEKLFFF